MKTATAELVALLNAAGGANPLIQFDFFTLTLTDGTMLRYGTAEFTIAAADATIWNPPNIDGSGGMWFDGINWPPSLMGEQSDGAIGHWKTGLDSDSWSLAFFPRQTDPVTGAAFPDKIGGVPWIQAARSGALDNADVIVSTAYFSEMPSGPLPLAGVSPVGTLITARGTVGTVDCSDLAAYIQVTDYRTILSQMMPRNLYQGSCRHRLYDSRCTLDAAAFTEAGTVLTATAGTTITATAAIAAPGGSATYTLGLLTMTSGLNDGFKRMVVSWDGAAAFQLLNPFPFPVAAADTFTVAAGCDKSLASCQLFGNELNFGGEPFIPVPETATA